MASLPSGVRRVYNLLYKRRVTSGNSYTPTPTQIKEYFDSQGFNVENITEEEFNQTISYFSSCESSLTTQQSSVELDIGHHDELNEGDTDNLSREHITESGGIILTEQQLQGIVSTKAVEMSIQLSTSDVEYVASRIDNIDTTLEDVITQTEKLLCAYADHKKQEGIQKIDAMFGRVYNHVQHSNQETSHHISNGLQQFGRDIEQAQQDFKSSVFNSLERLKIPGASA